LSTKVLFFASLREAVGEAELALDLDGPVSLDGLLKRLQGRLSPAGYAALTAENVRVAINQELQNGPLEVQPGDEVAFLPPVTGG
jgi:molybdopterin synthase sulfur carrier subunit